MLEAFTALFGIISAGIFIAHAVDGYRRSREAAEWRWLTSNRAPFNYCE